VPQHVLTNSSGLTAAHCLSAHLRLLSNPGAPLNSHRGSNEADAATLLHHKTVMHFSTIDRCVFSAAYSMLVTVEETYKRVMTEW
jgi:hypothetical protein